MKLSKHPVGTVIEVRITGRFVKISDGLWRQIDDPNCYLTKKYVKRLQKNSPEDITILAAPWSVVVELMTMVMDELGARDGEGNLITFDTIYKDAIERDAEFKRMRAAQEHILQDYCIADVKMTSAFFEKFFKGASEN
jgi:hypothetical protein